MFQKPVTKAKAGDNVGLLLRGVKRDVIQRGMFVCKPNTLTQTDAFTAQLYIQTKQEGGRTKPITSNYINQVSEYFMITYTKFCELLYQSSLLHCCIHVSM